MQQTHPYLPEALDRAVLTALAKDRADRHQTATQMRTELRALDPPRAPLTGGGTPDLEPRAATTDETALVPAGTSADQAAEAATTG